jgi:hypothetical protein
VPQSIPISSAGEYFKYFSSIIMFDKITFFFRYFKNCPVLDIPGFMYPVESTFLEDLPRSLTCSLPKMWKSSNVRNDEYRPFLDPTEVVNVIKWVNNSRPEGAMLVFLPGWSEIRRVRDMLENDYDRKSYVIFPIHSRYLNSLIGLGDMFNFMSFTGYLMKINVKFFHDPSTAFVR